MRDKSPGQKRGLSLSRHGNSGVTLQPSVLRFPQTASWGFLKIPYCVLCRCSGRTVAESPTTFISLENSSVLGCVGFLCLGSCILLCLSPEGCQATPQASCSTPGAPQCDSHHVPRHSLCLALTFSSVTPCLTVWW